MFFHDMKSACALFLPSPDTVMDTLCNHVDKQGQTAEDFLRMIKVVALKSSFIATARDMDKLTGEVRQRFSVTFLFQFLCKVLKPLSSLFS